MRGNDRAGVGVMEPVWSSEQSKLATQISLKDDASRTLKCSTKFILPDFKNKLLISNAVITYLPNCELAHNG